MFRMMQLATVGSHAVHTSALGNQSISSYTGDDCCKGIITQSVGLSASCQFTHLYDSKLSVCTTHNYLELTIQ